MNYVLPLILLIISSVLFFISKSEDMKLEEIFKEMQNLYSPKIDIEQVFETQDKCIEEIKPYFDTMIQEPLFIETIKETPYNSEEMSAADYVIYRNKILSNKYKQQDGFVTMNENLNLMIQQDYLEQKRNEDRAQQIEQLRLLKCEDLDCFNLVTVGKSDLIFDKDLCEDYAAFKTKDHEFIFGKADTPEYNELLEEFRKAKESGGILADLTETQKRNIAYQLIFGFKFEDAHWWVKEKIIEITKKSMENMEINMKPVYTITKDDPSVPFGCTQDSVDRFIYNEKDQLSEAPKCSNEYKCVNLKEVDEASIKSKARLQPLTDSTEYNNIIYKYIDEEKTPNPSDEDYGIAKKIQFESNAYSQYGFIPRIDKDNWNEIDWTIQQELDQPITQEEIDRRKSEKNALGLIDKYCEIRSKDSPGYIENKNMMERAYLQCLDNQRLWFKFMQGQYEEVKFSVEHCKDFKNQFPKNVLDKEYKMFQDCKNEVSKFKKKFHEYDPAELYNGVPESSDHSFGSCIINSEYIEDSPDGLVTNLEREKTEQKDKKRLNQKCLTEKRYGSAIFSILSNKRYIDILKQLEEQLEKEAGEEEKTDEEKTKLAEDKKKLEDEIEKHNLDVKEIKVKLAQCKQEEQEKINREKEGENSPPPEETSEEITA